MAVFGMTEPARDELTIFVKRDCATCELIVPVLQQLRDAGPSLTVISQDDPTFPAMDGVVHDESLELSWRANVETVPTLMTVANGEETGRTVGWHREQWEALTGATGLGPDLPAQRPGCGSMSVDPDVSDALDAKFGGGATTSRKVEFAELEDEFEAMHERGWSDGLPLVPPTPERVARMLSGTTRSPGDIVCVVPPTLVELSVEKIAINAVMAGCKPEYLPVVIAALEAVCTDEFNMHGLLATTMPNGPVFVVNGPIRNAIGMNAKGNVLGQGNRANSTIGRAVQLVVRNVGGGVPGGVDRATHGSPAKLGLCFPEDEEGSPWEPFSVDRGFDAGINTITAFAGEAPRVIFDQLSRDPDALVLSLAEHLKGVVSPRLAMAFDAILVLCPEHANRFAEAGWTKAQFREALDKALETDGSDIIRGAGGIPEGIPEAFDGHTIPKFDTNGPGGLMIVHAGADAGLFSSVIGGWVNNAMGSAPVTKEIHP